MDNIQIPNILCPDIVLMLSESVVISFVLNNLRFDFLSPTFSSYARGGFLVSWPVHAALWNVVGLSPWSMLCTFSFSSAFRILP